MSNTIKFMNDYYLDSSSIVHNKKQLNEYLNNMPIIFNVARRGLEYCWAKIASCKINGNWQERNLVLLIKGIHNSNSSRVVLVNISLSTNGNGEVSKTQFQAFSGTPSFNINDLYFEYKNGDSAYIWLKISTNASAGFHVTVLSNMKWNVSLGEKLVSTNDLPTTGFENVTIEKTYS